MLKRPLLTAGLTAAVLCPAAMAAPAIAGDGPPEPAKTRVSISHVGDGEFRGIVRSAEVSCRTGRKVTLYRKGVNSNKKVASHTPAKAQWKLTAFRSGTYFVKVPANATCKEGVSKEVKYTRVFN